MRTVCFAVLLSVQSIGWAADISVGGVSLAIPNPSGFSPVTQQMAALHDFQKLFVSPSNEEFLAFIPERDVSAALRGEIPELQRRFTVQTTKRLVRATVSVSDFRKLKETIKSQNHELIKKVEKKLPGIMKQLNEGFTKKYEADLALSVAQVVPMPVHEETDRTLGYSMFVKYYRNDEAGKLVPFVVVSTVTVVHVKSKLLFLYTYAEESGLEWSKAASKQWANAVVAANPLDVQASGIGWGFVIVFTIISLILVLIRRGKI